MTPLSAPLSLPRPRGLVLAPTRELVNQIDEVIQPLAEAYGMSTVTVYGGVSYARQVAGLRAGADIVVAADSSRFAQMEVQRCIMPTGGATLRMPERAGVGRHVEPISQQRHRAGPVAGGDLGHHGFGGSLANVVDHHVGALGGEGQRIGAAKAAAGAGDDDGTVVADRHGFRVFQ